MIAERVLVLGVGNDLLGDDAVGLLAAEALREEGLPVETTTRSGLALLDAVVGVRKVLLLDSQVAGAAVGEVQEFTLAPDAVRSPSAHYVGYGEALAIGAAAGLDLPDEIRVLAVERSPEVWLGTDLSDPVRAALPAVVRRAREIIRGWMLADGASLARPCVTEPGV
ncbi:MAG: hydrogenase maturation protease [Armatimonadota bacterium]|nr:hydrogenase maturation protease [Armatimonadota bacterium]